MSFAPAPSAPVYTLFKKPMRCSGTSPYRSASSSVSVAVRKEQLRNNVQVGTQSQRALIKRHQKARVPTYEIFQMHSRVQWRVATSVRLMCWTPASTDTHKYKVKRTIKGWKAGLKCAHAPIATHNLVRNDDIYSKRSLGWEVAQKCVGPI